jgi:hypothetical protein
MVDESFTVSFDVNEGAWVPGTGLEPFRVLKGRWTEEPSRPPVREGFAFAGWVDDATGEFWDFERPVERTLRLVASWTDEFHTVLFLNRGIESYCSVLSVIKKSPYKKRGS